MSAIRQFRRRMTPDNRLSIADRWAVRTLTGEYRRCRDAGMDADTARGVIWTSVWIGTLGIANFVPMPLPVARS